MTDRRGRRLSVREVSFSAVVAALYTALTLLFAPISFGPVQVRLSEAMTLLPMLFPQSIPGLALGCFLSNLIAGYGAWDMALGTLATLMAALATYRLRKKGALVCALPPVLFNATVIGLMLKLLGAAPDTALVPLMLTIGAGEAAACYALGVPLVKALSRARLDAWLKQ